MPKEAETNPFIISVKILHKESGSGIGNLLVELLDLDKWADPETSEKDPTGLIRDPAVALATSDIPSLYKLCDRLASGITDASGQCTFQVSPKNFNLPRKAEQKPDLVLLVLAPDEPGLDLSQRLLHFAKDLRLNAGSHEAYIIRLPSALLEKREIFVSQDNEDSGETTKKKLDSYVNESIREQEFEAGAAAFHGVQFAKERQELKVFRKDFIKKIATDFSAVQLSGVIAAEGDDIRQKNADIIGSGIAQANEALGGAKAQGVPVNLYLTPADMNRLRPFLETTADFVEIPDSEIKDLLFRTNNSENPGTLLIHNNPIASFCLAESADEKCAKLHSGISDKPTKLPPADPTTDEDGEIASEDIPTYIDRLLKHMPSPDEVLRPELAEKRANRADIEKAVNEFSLQKGPAEVPAFYDFNSLQIAFDHVWKQLFDETIPNLAFTANTLGKTQFGVDNFVDGWFLNGSIIANPRRTIRPVNVPTLVARFFDITKDEYNEMSIARRTTLIKLVTLINKRATLATSHKAHNQQVLQTLTEQVERLIDSVRHDNYYSLHKTLRDLHARLSGKYEFTVFAADKNHHSVNFGLMNTYRQQWTPLTYQAGRLVEDRLPLAKRGKEILGQEHSK